MSASSLLVLVLTASAAWAADGAAALSHLTTRVMLLPPPSLLRPLWDNEGASKGIEPVAEQALLNALRANPLRERILRVAVAGEGGASVALVKVQAGDAQSRLFSLEDVEQDALQTLRVALALPQRLHHVDFWAVVPYDGMDGTTWHRTVFSVSAEREHFYRVARGGPKTTRELLASLSAVRYDPMFTTYATDWAAAQNQMPRTAYTPPRIAEQWEGLLKEAAALDGASPKKPLSTVQVIVGGTPNKGHVALTIDDGPHPLVTPLILDILRREQVKATFFLVGDKAEEFPGLVREIARDGHEIGNHTYSHRRFSLLSAEEIYAEMRGCARIIGLLTGEVPTYLRPPGGDYNEVAAQVAARLGLTLALWTHNTGDWKKPAPKAIASRATHELVSGDIILMHQGGLESVRALPMIIQRIRAQGLRPARLSDVSGNGSTKRMAFAEAVAQRSRLNLAE